MTPEHFNVLILASTANALLALAVCRNNPGHPINRYFAAFAISVASWTISNGLVTVTASGPWGIVWARFTFASAAAIPLAFLWFTSVFPSQEPQLSKRLLMAATAGGVATIVLSFTPLIAASTAQVNRTLRVTYGPLHPFFAVYFVACFSFALAVLWRKWRVLTGIQRAQVSYVLFGVAAAAIGATTTNLVIPLLFKSSKFSAYGPLFGLLLLTIIAHAIIRHRLLNIGLVMRRQARYLLAGIVAVAALVVAVETSWHLFVAYTPDILNPRLLGLALAVVLLFEPLKRKVQDGIDRYFFREPYSYQKILRQITREMAGILDLQALLQYLTRSIGETVRCEYVAVYTREPLTKTYRPLAGWADLSKVPDVETFDAGSPLVRFMHTRHSYLLIDEPRVPENSDAQLELSRLGAHFAVPFLGDDGLLGFVLLGPRRSGDPYFTEDIDLLVTLASQATIAIKNAQLYSQVLHVEAEKRRSERLASIGSLAAGIAHEIKNPLVAIKAFAELLPERFGDEEFRGDFSKVASREIERIDDLVRRLAGLAGGAAECHARIDVREPIEETLALLRAQLQQAQIGVKTLYSADPALVAGDKAQLKQLFLNLMMNAIESMENGGDLVIRVYRRRTAARSLIVVEVSDEGQGVPAHLIGTIFDPFVTTKPHGTGLGLSISRGIADAHNAAIYARNNGSRKGATIVVEFPSDESWVTAEAPQALKAWD